MSATQHSTYLPVREDWLARLSEPALEPDLPIIDPHHHLWDRPDWRYLLPDLLADMATGHNIIGTVFVQARAFHRADGPEELKSLGETEFVNGVAAMSASGVYGPSRVCAGIVGRVDLTLGARAADVLQQHMRTAGERFRGIRHIVAWDADPLVLNPGNPAPAGLLMDKSFREGFACLAPLGLSFDAWLYAPQLGELIDLARAFPETPIVLNHFGGPLGLGSYAGKREAMFPMWERDIRTLAQCPNVSAKLGGLGMKINGFGFEDQTSPPDSDTLAAAWRPYMHTAIEAFGAGRCMFESNFPVDKGSYSYGVFWNACKKLAAGASAAEKADLFAGAAARFYRLTLPGV
jgi:predicted TIM-barrel fold metal-dependent hydrolase